ncbi:putative 2EXR domain-containing protein [Seiridium unicorne]|uniref:2EXR domain-containing protein n=1 Tax=Seiridium unicorne TaxID=138068 RepID=A0ABR2VCU8_9PEZI
MVLGGKRVQTNAALSSISKELQITAQLEESVFFPVGPSLQIIPPCSDHLKKALILPLQPSLNASSAAALQREITYTSKNKLGKSITSSGYRASTSGYHLYSKLLRVNHEARCEALHFYRVHVPCQFEQADGKTLKDSVLYFNPEYDFLHLSPPKFVQYTLVDFLHDLKAYDPLDAGLFNLAVDRQGLTTNDWLTLNPDHLDSRARTAYIETMSQLREVFWVTIPTGGRTNAGHQSGIPRSGFRFNGGFPIMSREPVFERIRSDPRPISEEIKRVIIATKDPRETILPWRRILANAGVQHTRDVQYRFLLSNGKAGESRNNVFGRDDAERLLEDESRRWRMNLERLASYSNRPARKIPPGPTEAAFGFWLFPVDADDEAPLGLSDNIPIKSLSILDLSAYWPELGLSELIG